MLLRTVSKGRMSPIADGKNVILTFENSIFTLVVSDSTYQWIKKTEQLSITRTDHVQLTVPSTFINCE